MIKKLQKKIVKKYTSLAKFKISYYLKTNVQQNVRQQQKKII